MADNADTEQAGKAQSLHGLKFDAVFTIQDVRVDYDRQVEQVTTTLVPLIKQQIIGQSPPPRIDGSVSVLGLDKSVMMLGRRCIIKATFEVIDG